ncbi:MAG: hypothetical protein RLZZ546_3260 [Bacteroidota bacterium]|jgi:sialate O-acetylesterase
MKNNFLLILFIFIINICNAQLKLAPIFSDNMVLQQEATVNIFGFAPKNTTIKITTSWTKKTYSSKSNQLGKWEIKIPTTSASIGNSIVIKNNKQKMAIKNVMLGEVWLCSGQSNMEMPLKGFKDQPILNSNETIFNDANDLISMFVVPRSVKLHEQDTIKQNIWKIATTENLSNYSATAFHFAKLMQKKLNVPIGLLNVSYGGTPVEAFMSKRALENFKEIKLPTTADSAKLTNKFATVIYNAMFKPVIGYTIKGCIWYQGESNYDKPILYESLFPAFVKFLRTEFGQGDFPFYYAQIAPFNYANIFKPNDNPLLNSAYLREAQRKALLQINNSSMIVLMDQGEENNIHPANKEIVGKRFAYTALAKDYGYKGFAYTSPSVDSFLIKDTSIIVKFGNAPNGITSFGKPITTIEIAGADKVFVLANVTIRNGTLIIYNKEIQKPKYVRYAFKDYVKGEIFSTEGFPISSFTNETY